MKKKLKIFCLSSLAFKKSSTWLNLKKRINININHLELRLLIC